MDHELKKISLITVSYNSADTIVDTIESIENQTYENIEYLVIDGASKDQTLDILKSKSNRLAKVISEPDKGIYDAYNKGLSLAKGEIIGFLNSDDFYCSNKVIEKIMHEFEDETVDAVYADLVYVDQSNTDRILRHWKSQSFKDGGFGNGFVPAHPTLFLRKSVYENAGNFDLSYRLAADYEFMLRIFHKFKIKSVYMPEIIVKMRAGGATGESFSSIRQQNIEISDALKLHEVEFSKFNFVIRKTLNRLFQRVRALFVKLPSEI